MSRPYVALQLDRQPRSAPSATASWMPAAIVAGSVPADRAPATQTDERGRVEDSAAHRRARRSPRPDHPGRAAGPRASASSSMTAWASWRTRCRPVTRRGQAVEQPADAGGDRARARPRRDRPPRPDRARPTGTATPAAVRPRDRHAPRLADGGDAAGHDDRARGGPTRSEPVEPGHQHLASPQRAVGAVAEPVEGEPEDRSRAAVVDQAGGDVCVVVLHARRAGGRAPGRTWSTGTRGAGRGPRRRV